MSEDTSKSQTTSSAAPDERDATTSDDEATSPDAASASEPPRAAGDEPETTAHGTDTRAPDESRRSDPDDPGDPPPPETGDPPPPETGDPPPPETGDPPPPETGDPPPPDPDDPDYYHVEGEYVADEDEDSDEYYFPEYIGETKRRSAWVATLLTLLAPGLGYVYMGRFVTGMLVNLAFLAATSGLLLSWVVMKYFPLYPLLVFALCWLVMVGLILWDVHGLRKREHPFVVRPTNHPIVYVSVFLFTFAVPLYLTIDWSFSHVWQRTWAGSDAMYPTIVRGDLVLVDRTSFMYRRPERGELVLVGEPDEAEAPGVYFARVVGVPEDRVHMEGALPWVNGKQLEQLRHAMLDELEAHPPLESSVESSAKRRAQMWAYVETPFGVKVEDDEEPERWYMIARPLRPLVEPTERVVLDEDELFVLTDNRAASFERPSSHTGGRVIEREWVLGRPLFVLFSISPDEGEVRWDRIGLRLR